VVQGKRQRWAWISRAFVCKQWTLLHANYWNDWKEDFLPLQPADGAPGGDKHHFSMDDVLPQAWVLLFNVHRWELRGGSVAERCDRVVFSVEQRRKPGELVAGSIRFSSTSDGKNEICCCVWDSK